MTEVGTLGKHVLSPTVSLQTPRPLQQLVVPLISRETCSCLYNINAVPDEPHTIQQDMLCAGYVKGGKDACQVTKRQSKPERAEGSWQEWPQPEVYPDRAFFFPLG